MIVYLYVQLYFLGIFKKQLFNNFLTFFAIGQKEKKRKVSKKNLLSNA